MARTRREQLQHLTKSEIRATARELMAERGTAGLSLRAIARKMGLSAPALYHYYASLNDLITALIEDGFVRLADSLEAAANAAAAAGVAAQLRAVAQANRQWALAHPVDYQLLYGNPIPNYQQPIDITYPPARRSFLLTARLLAEAWQQDQLQLPPNWQHLPPALTASLHTLTEVPGHQLPLPALYLAAVAWSRLHGIVMLELFNLLQPVIADVEAMFNHEIDQFLDEIGLEAAVEE